MITEALSSLFVVFSEGAKLWSSLPAECQEVLQPHLNTKQVTGSIMFLSPTSLAAVIERAS